MGAVFELYFISDCFIQITNILEKIEILLSENITILNVKIMDDWEFSNVICLEDLTVVKAFVEHDKISCIELSDTINTNMGMFIERQGSIFLYNLWIDTIHCPWLDVDVVNNRNEKFYDDFYKIINVLDNDNNHGIKLASLGVEIEFKFNEKLSSIISDSYNVTSWIIPRESNINIKGYHEKSTESKEMKIFEKIYMRK